MKIRGDLPKLKFIFGSIYKITKILVAPSCLRVAAV